MAGRLGGWWVDRCDLGGWMDRGCNIYVGGVGGWMDRRDLGGVDR